MSIFDPAPSPNVAPRSKIPITGWVGLGFPTPASMLEDRSELFFFVVVKKKLLLNVTVLMLVIDPKIKRRENNKCERKQVIWVFLSGLRFSWTGGQTDRPGEP